MIKQSATKKMRLEHYLSGGELRVDLFIEKDAGNSIMVSMGNPDSALRAYERLRKLCDAAIKVLEPKVGGREQWTTGT